MEDKNAHQSRLLADAEYKNLFLKPPAPDISAFFYNFPPIIMDFGPSSVADIFYGRPPTLENICIYMNNDLNSTSRRVGPHFIRLMTVSHAHYYF